MGSGAGPGRIHWGKHGSRPAGGHQPMLVGRELEELCWEPVQMENPRLTAHLTG